MSNKILFFHFSISEAERAEFNKFNAHMTAMSSKDKPTFATANGYYTKEEWNSLPCIDNNYGYGDWEAQFSECPEHFSYHTSKPIK